MPENKDRFKKQNGDLNLISESENQLSKDSPATVKGFFYYGYCPRCGNSVEGPKEIFCPRCGQALLWPSFSENEREPIENSYEETGERNGQDGFCSKTPGDLDEDSPF